MVALLVLLVVLLGLIGGANIKSEKESEEKG
ncbi:hypothetical protein GLYMA_16G159350v4 [Glycine max]|nr:hypothetical protein GLYMA_16G159350v4 [Glycine max]KAH1151638.1 hypothetical protein GYH30_045239 [Glycine max]